MIYDVSAPPAKRFSLITKPQLSNSKQHNIHFSWHYLQWPEPQEQALRRAYDRYKAHVLSTTGVEGKEEASRSFRREYMEAMLGWLEPAFRSFLVVERFPLELRFYWDKALRHITFGREVAKETEQVGRMHSFVALITFVLLSGFITLCIFLS